MIVFERDFNIGYYDITNGNTGIINIQRKGSASSVANTHTVMSNGFREPVLSPDGKKIAFTARGKIFVTAAQDGGSAVRVPHEGTASGITWDNNSNILLYATQYRGLSHIYE